MLAVRTYRIVGFNEGDDVFKQIVFKRRSIAFKVAAPTTRFYPRCGLRIRRGDIRVTTGKDHDHRLSLSIGQEVVYALGRPAASQPLAIVGIKTMQQVE